MADFKNKIFANSGTGEGLVWLRDDSFRKTYGGYLYGLCSKRLWKANDYFGFRRVPLLKSVSFKSGGQVVRKMPITAVTTRGIVGLAKEYLHPVLDPNYGICVYGLNIQGTSIDTDVLSQLPYASATATSRGWAKSVSGAISWFNAEETLFSMMPSTLTSSKKKGNLYDNFDSVLHIGNGFAPINNERNVIESDGNTFPFYYYTTSTKTISGRTDITEYPSVWAVVHCVNCAPYGIGEVRERGVSYEMNEYFPSLNVNEFDNVYFRIRSISGNRDVMPVYHSNGEVIYRVYKLWEYPNDSNEAVYFMWIEPCSWNGVTTISYGQWEVLPTFISPPIIGVVPAPVQEVGQKMEVRILQYGVEFNL